MTLACTAGARVIDQALLETSIQDLPIELLVSGEGVELNGVTYFTGVSADSGAELWRTDGTVEGTTIVRDIVPGEASSDPSMLARSGERFLFQAHDDDHGRELWVSDGTPEGTYLLKDIAAGATSSFPVHFVQVSGQTYFRAFEQSTGTELWVTDGTAEGTRLVRDIAAGTEESFPGVLTAMDDRLYFRASTPEHGSELWAYDPSADMLTLRDLVVGGGSSLPYHLHSYNDQVLYFRTVNSDGSRSLWALTELMSNAFLMRDVDPGRVRVSWKPPTTFADGSPLHDLLGYKLYHGSDPVNLSQSITIEEPTRTEYVLSFLAPGWHYFALTAVSASAGESAPTRIVSKLIL